MKEVNEFSPVVARPTERKSIYGGHESAFLAKLKLPFKSTVKFYETTSLTSMGLQPVQEGKVLPRGTMSKAYLANFDKLWSKAGNLVEQATMSVDAQGNLSFE